MPVFKEKELVQLVRKSATKSFNKLSGNYEKFEEADEIYTCYQETQTSEEEKEEEDYGVKPTIKIPFITALMQSLISYLITVFTSKLPFVQIEGLGPEDVVPAKKQTLMIAHQMQRIKGLLKLHQFLFDAVKYGQAWGKKYWEVKESNGYIRYKGNNWENIYPEFVLYDPRVSPSYFQDGEFIMHIGNMHRYDLMKEANQGNYDRKAVKAVPDEVHVSDLIDDKFHPFLYKSEYHTKKDRNTVYIEDAYIKLNPREYALDETDEYEIWNIVLANRSKIIKADKIDDSYGKFPFICGQAYPDLYLAFNKGMPHMLEELQRYVDFLFNSHLANVRRGVNMIFVYDPVAIHEEDLKANKFIKWIRMKELAMGRKADEVFYQVPVNDITRANVEDAVRIMELMQKISGVVDIVMGMPYTARRSATEISGTQRFAANRIKTLAELINEQAFVELIEMFVLGNIDFLDEPTWARILGGWEKEYEEIAYHTEGGEATPFVKIEGGKELRGNFDYTLTDAIMPVDRVSDSAAWAQILQILGQNPMLMQQLDPVAVFKQFAYSLGIKNISSFINPMVVPTGEAGAGGGQALTPGPEAMAGINQEEAKKKLSRTGA